MKGRPRIHEDSKARKRSYYARNAEREREKARERWHSRKARKQKKEAFEASSRAAACVRARCLPLSAKLLGPGMRVQAETIGGLWARLQDDLRAWRLQPSDRDELEHITTTVLDLDRVNMPVAELYTALQQRMDILDGVAEVALAAATVSWSLDPDRAMMEGSVWGKYNELVDLARGLLGCLEEIVTLYRDDPHLLRSRSADQTLIWQSLF
ncbi:hypothetical protein AURDEDRAFT_178330 [Auricularia subglabra TFB-10046 SS5]|uniref:Uncharacterized protein n=1 Tax=Auricularia subglabra (strain TFB-10046 / SS5) TaxID=717982 RepID=J0L8C7_AURST|nr:hypothetical protein AURDEDRAFT_178330 [Auricularia subglabra TFB-10046 SS5]